MCCVLCVVMWVEKSGERRTEEITSRFMFRRPIKKKRNPVHRRCTLKYTKGEREGDLHEVIQIQERHTTESHSSKEKSRQRAVKFVSSSPRV